MEFLIELKVEKGLINTLFQILKIGKIHPAKLILNSQSINGLNLLEIADKKPEQIQKSLKELITLYMEKKISLYLIMNLTGIKFQMHTMV